MSGLAIGNRQSEIGNGQQPTLRLRLSADVTLVPLDMAAASAGIHLDHALERVESGEWPWAFDLRAGAEVRRLHVWRPCLEDSAFRLPHSALDEVVGAVIGTTMDEVRLVSLEVRWSLRAQTIRRWVLSGDVRARLAGHTLWLDRASLAAFLKRRRV